MTPLVLYHGGCRDGWASAVVAKMAMPPAELVACNYGDPVPLEKAKGRSVFVLDYSWKRADMKALILSTKGTVVLDHHATAQAELEGILDELQQIDQRQPGDHVVFDMERSGAGLAWRHFFPNVVPPFWVNYVEDRDLWRFALPDSQIINAWLGTLPFELGVWSGLPVAYADYHLALGKAVQNKTAQYVAEVRRNTRWISVDWPGKPAELMAAPIPIINAPQVDISELLRSFIDEGAPMAIGFFQRADGYWQYSLRSREDIDVSELARRFGGGGHKNAAGFQKDFLVHGRVGMFAPLTYNDLDRAPEASLKGSALP